jgi:hypothetical protein
MEPTESAIIFVDPSTDTYNTVLSSAKENCTNGIVSGFPLIDI